MALQIPADKREMFEKDLAAAKPYTDDEMRVLDEQRDHKRVRATFAQKFLRIADDSKKTDM